MMLQIAQFFLFLDVTRLGQKNSKLNSTILSAYDVVGNLHLRVFSKNGKPYLLKTYEDVKDFGDYASSLLDKSQIHSARVIKTYKISRTKASSIRKVLQHQN